MSGLAQKPEFARKLCDVSNHKEGTLTLVHTHAAMHIDTDTDAHTDTDAPTDARVLDMHLRSLSL